MSDTRGLTSIGDIAQDWLARRKQGKVRAYTTGFPEIDEEYGKLLPGTTSTIFAPSGLGKSAMLFSMVLRHADAGINCVFLSLEMSKDLMMCRAISIKSGIPLKALTEGRLGPREYEYIESMLPHFKPLPVSISEENDVKRVETLLKETVEESSDTVVYLDYMGLLRLGKSTGPTGYELMTVFSQKLVDLSRFLDVPFVVAAQSNREPNKRDDKKPRQSDLREAGECDASKVIGLFRKSFYSREQRSPGVDNLEVHFLKNRNGPLGKVDLKFIGPTAEVTEWSADEKAERAWDAVGVSANEGREW